ncbi:hypothetical protein BDM02DRAFT_1433931 [Thelephora ganbajun]|uniref:Uncharacterized protein n=1 Tax=Thelephora ganbajun TaxID=370292 RepID=A0ACB6ZLZ7_THEGA|nr:hypothetical protein BDM02DRAFT_1433931 [Thelephora ganbajun]
MPSLFSRARTTSTSKPSQTSNGTDEFGRAPTPLRSKSSFTTPTKKDKKDKSARSRTLSTPDHDTQEYFPEIPDGSFLPLNLNPPRFDSHEREITQDYGYLSYKRHVVLGLEEITRLVEVTSQEIGARGLTTPFIFSALALDLSASATTRLIEAFLQTCNSRHPSVEQKWQEEAQFAGPHELGMCLRWGLARAVRIVGGLEIRGLLNYESYIEWRDSESAMNYPPAIFASFLDSLDPTLQPLLVTLLTLLSRLSAHSASSGHTPPTLSPLFGPLLFGLGASSLSFHHAYHRYLRATNATEHLILAFIRWQDATSTSGLGVPARLKDWIRGYPSMLPSLPTKKQERPLPRKGAKTIRVATVRRNVRMYSPDLVKTAANWASRPKGPNEVNSLTSSKEWERIALPTLKLFPRYSDTYRKRMNLPSPFHPDIGPGASSLQLSLSSTSSTNSIEGGPLLNNPEDRFRSLTDLKWGEFEASGFGDLADDKKLQFDLTEGARAARRVKRQTLTWNDFSQAGFSRMDDPLNTTLQFSTPLTATINQWPTQSAEISKKLKKTQKSLPPFGWDTEPVMASEEVIEEAFVDVFCDLVYGGGWMDIERGEEVDRECNWALVEYKALPTSRSNTVSGTGDPRTSTTLILYEEFVPLEYRQQLAASGNNRKKLPSLFSSKPKQWKPAATLNGKPYTLGSVPASPSYREVEFEGILRAGNTTRVIKVDSKNSKPVASPLSKSTSSPDQPRKVGLISGPLFITKSDSPAHQSEHTQTPTPIQTLAIPSSFPVEPGEDTPTKQKSRFRIPGGLPVGGSASARRRSGLPPAEYDTIDFETRLASYSDDELNGGFERPMTKQEKRQSRDDAWVDILVSGNGRRLGSQDAVMRAGRSDPDLAKQEVAQVLAAVKGHPPSDDEQDEVVMEPVDASTRFSVENPPSGSDHGPFGTDTTEEEEDAPAPLPRRPGYFDLHPERRRAVVSTAEDDPRSRLAHDDSDSEADYPRKESLDWGRQFGDNEPEPRVVVPVQTVTPPRALPPKPDAKLLSPQTNGESLLPSPTIIQPQPQPSKSKTSSLIEMYREKERAAAQPAPPPARSPQPSVSPQPVPQQPIRPLPLPVSKPGPIDVPPGPPRTPSPDPSEGALAKYEQSPNGPGRYIHGAPLHNVLEEEEE